MDFVTFSKEYIVVEYLSAGAKIVFVDLFNKNIFASAAMVQMLLHPAHVAAAVKGVLHS